MFTRCARKIRPKYPVDIYLAKMLQKTCRKGVLEFAASANRLVYQRAKSAELIICRAKELNTEVGSEGSKHGIVAQRLVIKRTS